MRRAMGGRRAEVVEMGVVGDAATRKGEDGDVVAVVVAMARDNALAVAADE